MKFKHWNFWFANYFLNKLLAYDVTWHCEVPVQVWSAKFGFDPQITDFDVNLLSKLRFLVGHLLPPLLFGLSVTIRAG